QQAGRRTRLSGKMRRRLSARRLLLPTSALQRLRRLFGVRLGRGNTRHSWLATQPASPRGSLAAQRHPRSCSVAPGRRADTQPGTAAWRWAVRSRRLIYYLVRNIAYTLSTEKGTD